MNAKYTLNLFVSIWFESIFKMISLGLHVYPLANGLPALVSKKKIPLKDLEAFPPIVAVPCPVGQLRPVI